MTMRISRAAHAAMLAQARADPSHEVCGLLLGAADRIVQAVSCANVAADRARQFAIDPAALFAAQRAERAGGAHVIGVFHSHPNGRATPSPTDDAMAARDGRIWAIIAAGRVTMWRATAGGFTALDYRIDD